MKRKFLALGLILCLLLALSAPAWADFGSFSGDSDYGGGSDWGSSDSSWSNNDYYYSGSTSSDDGGGFGTMAALFVAIIIIGMIMSKKGGKGKNQQPVNAGGTFTTGLRSMSEYSKLDPTFDQQEFTEKLSNLYVKIQNAWTDTDIEPMRPYFTDALFTQLERQLNTLKSKGWTNHVERIAVLSVDPRGFKQAGGEDHIYVSIQARIIDYTMDANGKLVSGDMSREKFMTYEWDLSRASGVQTQAESQKEQKTICPSCGAPLDVNASARCPYCGTVITKQQTDWAICAIKGISQRTN